MAVLEVSGLSRDYRTRKEVVHALRDVDLQVDAGEVVGLLGLNGAGKTTMLKVISTLLLPTSGTVRVDGFDVVSETREARGRLSVVLGGERGFYNRLAGATTFASSGCSRGSPAVMRAALATRRSSESDWLRRRTGPSRVTRRG